MATLRGVMGHSEGEREAWAAALLSATLRLWAGFVRPFTLISGLRADPEAWRRYVRTTGWQALATLGLAVVFVALGGAADADESDGERASLVSPLVQWLALIGGSLVTAQWITLALSHEYQDPLARALSVVAGIRPEDEDVTPRLRLGRRWLVKKARQRLRWWTLQVRGAVALIPLSPLFLLLGVAGLAQEGASALMVAWTAYWWCAFTAARSARAWRDEAAGTLPLFVQRWRSATESTTGLRWLLPRWQGRLLVWAARPEAAPAVAMEKDVLTFIGLGLARLATAPPLLRLFFRAAIDTASAEALERCASGCEEQAASLGSAPAPPPAAGEGRAPTEAPPTEAPPTEAPPTEAPPTEAPPTEAAPTEAAPTEAAPTEAAPTEVPPTATGPAPSAEG
jgi:hypothetical protein